MGLYKVLEGNHYEGSTRYRKGDVLECDRPLDEIFRAKFMKMEAKTEERVKIDPPKEEKTIKELILEDYKPEQLVALHRGAGKYIVVSAEDDSPVHAGYLTKEVAFDIAGDPKDTEGDGTE